MKKKNKRQRKTKEAEEENIRNKCNETNYTNYLNSAKAMLTTTILLMKRKEFEFHCPSLRSFVWKLREENNRRVDSDNDQTYNPILFRGT